MQVEKNGVLEYKGVCAVIRIVLSQGQGQRLTKVDRVDIDGEEEKDGADDDEF